MSRKYGVDNANLFCVFSHFYFWQQQSFILCVSTFRMCTDGCAFASQHCTPALASSLLAICRCWTWTYFFCFLFLKFLELEKKLNRSRTHTTHSLCLLDSFGWELFISGHSISLLFVSVCVCVYFLGLLLAFHWMKIAFLSHRSVPCSVQFQFINGLAAPSRVDFSLFRSVSLCARSIPISTWWKWNRDYMLTPLEHTSNDRRRKNTKRND